MKLRKVKCPTCGDTNISTENRDFKLDIDGTLRAVWYCECKQCGSFHITREFKLEPTTEIESTKPFPLYSEEDDYHR